MDIEIEKADWVFLLPCASRPEDRHIMDILLGLKVLLSKNVPMCNITLIIDNLTNEMQGKFQIEGFQIFDSMEMKKAFKNLSTNTAIVVITGHGSTQGLDSNPPIKPFFLLQAIEENEKLKNAFIFLGQCFAGIFNYLKPIPRNNKENQHSQNLVFIGATNMSESISVPYELDGILWHANLLFIALFQWILTPIDFDGDGNFSIMDLFKNIIYVIDDICYKKEKEKQMERSVLGSEYLSRLSVLEKKESLTPDERLEMKSIQDRLQTKIIHQEAWIFNPNFAITANIKTP